MEAVTSLPAWLRILSEFLTQRGVLDADQLSRVRSLHAKLDRRIGQLALLMGYVSLKQVFAILGVQAENPLRFGEAAVRTGALTPSQVQEILSLQKSPSDLFLQTLVFAEFIESSHLPALMEDLRRFLGDKNRAPQAPSASPTPADDGERVGRDEVRTVLKRIRSIGTLPAVVQRILAMTDDPNCEVRAVGKVVTTDPNLTVQLLRVVNSAALGGARRISNASDAISRIGIRGLRNVALATAVLDRFQGSDRKGMRRIWAHSVLTSLWAQTLAAARKERYPEEDAFIAGLIHDLGSTILRQFFPEAATRVDRQVSGGRAPGEAEQEAFGQTHEDAGAYLCELWSLPAATTQAVLYHHAGVPVLKALPDLQPLTALVNGACRLADLALVPEDEAGNRRAIDALDPEFRAFHKIDGSLALLFPAIHARSLEMSAWLG
jgi:HD-like signal output (HDOD) protein